MITRRACLALGAATGAALAIDPASLLAADGSPALIMRIIPGTEEQLPAIGLGSSASFATLAGTGDIGGLRAVMQAFVQHGGTVFDTAPSYGEAERLAGQIAQEEGIGERLFWATKLNAAARGGGSADRAAARRQLEQSITWRGRSPIDLVQVHNLSDVPTQLGLLKEYRDEARVRYIGVTTTYASQYEELERIMRTEPLDFIGIDYAIDNRTMEKRIFPLAQERGIGVLAYQPFGRTRLWQRVAGHALPDWAAEYGIASWAQFFLKFTISHPAITVATPASSHVRHVIDNMQAATGRLPDEAARGRMIRHIESL